MDCRQLIQTVEGVVLQNNHSNEIIRQLLIDSRKLMAPKGAVFFAISGVRHDGHKYIHALYEKGVRIFVLEDPSFSIQGLKDATVILVSQAVRALQQCASYKRSQFNIPVIGITGSNAKTIVKEWLSQVLQQDFSVVKNPRSYNSQVGVPLSVWQMNERHQIGVFEAGISKVNEMEFLEPVIRPSLGLFTNIGSAHDEGFESRQQKIQEKLKLFVHADPVIYCRDHEDIHAGIINEKVPGFHWSLRQDADIRFRADKKESFQTTVNVQYKEQSGSLVIPFTDDASVENALHVAAVLFYLGYPVQDVNKKISQLHAIEMRLELKEAVNGCYVIDDSYNNDLAGLSIAMDFLEHVKQRPYKSIILSDLLESGLPPEQLYQQVAELLQSGRLHRVITVGTQIQELKKYYTSPVEWFEHTDALIKALKHNFFEKEIILIKGARSFQFEKIVHALQYKIHETVLEIHVDALVHNLNVYRSKLKPGTKVMAMVKAFAYGSGSFEVAQMLQYQGVDYLAVAYADEGARLRENGITLPVMVMNPSYDSFDTLLRYGLEPEIYQFTLLQQIIDYAHAREKQIGLHLKFDTGMKRLGFLEKELVAVVALLKPNQAYVKIISVFTHLAASDEAIHDSFTAQQLATFTSIAERLEQEMGYGFIRHAANSSAIMRLPEAHFDMVRLGIGLYGVESAGLYQHALKNISTFKTHISQIKDIEAGETVGYSRKGTVQTASRIATIAVGYADGYDRRFSNGRGHVLVNGVKCPVIGNVCMDMTMIDVSKAHAKEGDEVILFGEQLPVSELAASIGTISYEILTSVGERVKRVFYSE